MTRLLAIAGVLGAFVPFAGCSDDSDSIEEACQVVVEDCSVGESMGECIDAMIAMTDDCIECILGAGCNYVTTCQEGTTAVCRLPPELGGPTP
jgi:hypothetical protein